MRGGKALVINGGERLQKQILFAALGDKKYWQAEKKMTWSYRTVCLMLMREGEIILLPYVILFYCKEESKANDDAQMTGHEQER